MALELSLTGLESFDEEVTRAICSTRILEQPKYLRCSTGGPCSVGVPLATEYLLARTKAGDAPDHCPSHKILHTVNTIIRLRPDLEYKREHYLRSLCYLYIETWYPCDWRSDRGYPNLNGPVAENLFAAAAYLGITSIFNQAVENGTDHVTTIFG